MPSLAFGKMSSFLWDKELRRTSTGAPVWLSRNGSFLECVFCLYCQEQMGDLVAVHPMAQDDTTATYLWFNLHFAVATDAKQLHTAFAPFGLR